MKCPGQDMRYWKDDAAFEVPCPKCGYSVELFKDETSGRCPKCAHRFKNPKMDFECATWCAYAEECLGFAPPREGTSNLGEGALAGRLISAVKEHCEADPGRITHAMVVFQHAKRLLAHEGGDPRVVFAAALLLEIEILRAADRPIGHTRSAAETQAILEETGITGTAAGRACGIIQNYLSQTDLDTVEFQIVSDAHRLTDMAAEQLDSDRDRLDKTIHQQLKTESARARAGELFRAK